MSLFSTAIFCLLFTVHFLFIVQTQLFKKLHFPFLTFSLKMNRPENFNDLPVDERTQIIQLEKTKIEEGKTHNAHTVKRIRKLRLEIYNLFNPDTLVRVSQSEHGSRSNVSEPGDNVGKSNVSEHGSNVSSDVGVNETTGMTEFNDFLDDP